MISIGTSSCVKRRLALSTFIVSSEVRNEFISVSGRRTLSLVRGRDHLADDDVDEPHLLGLVAAHRQQRLGAFQAHGRAQAAVELEERGLGEGADRLVMVDGLVDVMEAGHAGQRLHVLLADPAAGLLVSPDVIQPLELGDRRVALAVGLHLLGRMLEYVARRPYPFLQTSTPSAREPISHADRMSRGPISQQSSVTTGVWTCSYAHTR